MPSHTLADFVEVTASKLNIPGVAVGLWADGRESCACHGVPGARSPLPVDRDTRSALGSGKKTSTATALMRIGAHSQVMHRRVGHVPAHHGLLRPTGFLPDR